VGQGDPNGEHQGGVDLAACEPTFQILFGDAAESPWVIAHPVAKKTCASLVSFVRARFHTRPPISLGGWLRFSTGGLPVDEFPPMLLQAADHQSDQYSSASMIVMTRWMTDGSAGSGECIDRF
jgi:hypothetical protein